MLLCQFVLFDQLDSNWILECPIQEAVGLFLLYWISMQLIRARARANQIYSDLDDVKHYMQCNFICYLRYSLVIRLSLPSHRVYRKKNECWIVVLCLNLFPLQKDHVLCSFGLPRPRIIIYLHCIFALHSRLTTSVEPVFLFSTINEGSSSIRYESYLRCLSRRKTLEGPKYWLNDCTRWIDASRQWTRSTRCCCVQVTRKIRISPEKSNDNFIWLYVHDVPECAHVSSLYSINFFYQIGSGLIARG